MDKLQGYAMLRTIYRSLRRGSESIHRIVTIQLLSNSISVFFLLLLGNRGQSIFLFHQRTIHCYLGDHAERENLSRKRIQQLPLEAIKASQIDRLHFK